MSRATALLRRGAGYVAPIRSVLCWAFALEALMFLRPAITVLPHMLRTAVPGLTRSAHALSGPWWRILAGVAAGMSAPALTILFGMAWWTVWRRRPAAWRWASAASIANVLAGCALYYLFQSYSTSLMAMQLSLPVVAVGAAGLFVFSPRSLAVTPAGQSSAPPRIAGDGTHALLDRMIWVLSVGGYLALIDVWERWAVGRSLARVRGLPYYLEILLASLLVVLVHELGHVAAGKTLGMKVRAFIVGPFQWRIYEGRRRFEFHPARLFAMGGATGVVPTRFENFRRDQVWMVGAGPGASLLGGLAATYATLHVPGTRWEPAWTLFALTATISLLAAVLNLLPFRSGGQYSDGAQLYQLLSKGPWSDYHRALSIAGSSLVTPLRPREYDIAALRRAAACIAQGIRGLHLRLLESSYHLDGGRLAEAAQVLAEAEAVYHGLAEPMPVEWHTVFVFGAAYLQRDAASARMWWQRMEASKPAHFNVDYWLARAALAWIEDRTREAEADWQEANAAAQRLPAAGAYQFDRSRVALLRRAMDGAAPVEAREALPATTA